jgi:hypothetical protein
MLPKENPAALAGANRAHQNDQKHNIRPTETEQRVLIARMLQRDLRRVARARRDDPLFPWAKFGDFVANEQRKIPAGKTPSAETMLCRGKERVFQTLADVPPHIAREVAAGIDTAMARAAPMRRCGDDFAHGLGVTWAERERLGVWLIGAADCSRDEREIRQKEKRNADQRRRRRAAGMVARETYEARSIVEIKPWKLAGKSRRWFYNQTEAERERLRNEALRKCTSLKPPSLINSHGFTPVHSPLLEAGAWSVPPNFAKSPDLTAQQ